ncbi:MAG: ABC transporter substrate-binding protein [Desulfovibrionaceae bacterium]|nr:ABC transporter substrate-binding protein [Desulfovibrionaceae bacterium]
MMDIRHWLAAALLLLLCLAAPFRAQGEETEKRWNVLYVEGGPFANYQQTLAHTAKGLEQVGLIRNGGVSVPEGTESAREMWLWLSEHAGGRLHFLEDGFYSAEWDPLRRAEVKKAVWDRVKNRRDVDMIIAMGTWSGLDMAEEDLGVPVFSMSVTDAVAAGIVKSAEDSGKDNVHARVEPGRFRRQIQLFHEVFHFKTLGVPYEDTRDGRSTAGLEEIERAAEDLGIELVRCTAPLDLPDHDRSFENLRSCIAGLSCRADAIYLTYSSVPVKRIPELIRPVIKAGIPSFSQSGPLEVEHGVLMSLAQTDFAGIGRFEAEAIRAVVGGKKPREVSQVYMPELGLAINLKTAMQIGWNPPIELLTAVDAIYNGASMSVPVSQR